MPRRPDATGRRFAVVLIAGRLEPTSTAYIRAPELHLALDQPPVILLELPWPAFEEGKVFFPKSGQFGRRQAPVDSVTTRASPSPISPPRTLPPSRECNPSINFGRRPPQPKNHFVTEASLRRGARRRRLPPPSATPRPPEGPPRSGGSIPALRCPRKDAIRRRQSPDATPLLGQRRGGSGDWSNLTSGPPGPTVSDPAPPPRV